jgi:site-specific DNA recombinase
VPKKSRAGCFPTTGLMFCKKCGYSMKYSVDSKPNKKTGKVYNYTKCYHIDPYGNKCTQRGIKMDEDFYKALYDMIIGSYLNTDHSSQIQSDGGEKQVLQALLSSKQKMTLKPQ